MTEETHQQALLAHHRGLDGLRGVAVILVIIFHSGLGWLPGGFLGVSVFFTLSGFLITSLLINECENTGRIDLKAFWGRRLRRLAPASLVVIAGVVGLASWLSTSIEASRIKGDAISATLYFSNWRFIYSGHSYGELFASPSPLQHLWSLSIEEQLYVIVPVVVAGLFSLGLRRRAIGYVFLVAVAASTIATMFTNSHELIYYGTHTRAAELLLGAALACLFGQKIEQLARQKAKPWATLYIVPLSGVVVLSRFSSVDSPWVYSGALTVFAGLSVVCLLASIQAGPVRSFLSGSPLVRVGEVSYGLYLIHWPVIVWLNSDRIDLNATTLFGVQVAVTVIVTLVSYWLIEQPIRQRKILRSFPLASGSFGMAVVGVIVLASAVLASAETQVDTTPKVLVTLAPTTTPVADSSTNVNESDVPTRVDRTGPLSVLVIGDSTAENIATAMANAADGNIAVISGGVLGCPLLKVAYVRDRKDSQQDVSYCPDNGQLVQDHVADVDAIVIVAGVANQWAYKYAGSEFWVEPESDQYAADLNAFLENVEEIVAPQGVPVLVFETPPVRDNPKILGDDIAALVRWADVIQQWDADWHSVKMIPYADALSDPNSDEGKVERPDGVHLAEDFGKELARVILIPRLRDKYFDALDEMNQTQCRSGVDMTLDLDLCRVSQ
ncbi:MAG: acyltransferase family protein [Actinomycetota bacterium]|nr:acyltransferase family protein [Actinomycetota bacterium]MDA3019209.1 acyltransferase family protein [Actinomycetota bacterium]